MPVVNIQPQDPLEALEAGTRAAAVRMQSAIRGRSARAEAAARKTLRLEPTVTGAPLSPTRMDSRDSTTGELAESSPDQQRRLSLSGRRLTDVEDNSVTDATREKQVGRLTIKIMHGSNMVNCDASTKDGSDVSDPFCLVKVRVPCRPALPHPPLLPHPPSLQERPPAAPSAAPRAGSGPQALPHQAGHELARPRVGPGPHAEGQAG